MSISGINLGSVTQRGNLTFLKAKSPDPTPAGPEDSFSIACFPSGASFHSERRGNDAVFLPPAWAPGARGNYESSMINTGLNGDEQGGLGSAYLIGNQPGQGLPATEQTIRPDGSCTMKTFVEGPSRGYDGVTCYVIKSDEKGNTKAYRREHGLFGESLKSVQCEATETGVEIRDGQRQPVHAEWLLSPRLLSS